MKKLVLVLISIGLIAMSGCNTGQTGRTALTSDITEYDFGVVEAEAGTAEVKATFTNTGEGPVTVTSVVLSDTENYSLSDIAAPVTYEISDSSEVSCTFQPQGSGTFNAEITVDSDQLEAPLVVSLTGEGNYAPVLGTGMMVYDEVPAIAGFYAEDGEENGKPKYRKSDGSGYVMYYFVPPPMSFMPRLVAAPASGWVIHDEAVSIVSSSEAQRNSEENPATPDQVTAWNDVNGNPYNLINIVDNTPGPAVSGGTYEPGTTIYVYYLFEDTESDPEGSSAVQWYHYNDGTPAAIPGETGTSYTVQSGDSTAGILVEVTPAAETGITEGEPVKSQVFEPLREPVG